MIRLSKFQEVNLIKEGYFPMEGKLHDFSQVIKLNSFPSFLLSCHRNFLSK